MEWKVHSFHARAPTPSLVQQVTKSNQLFKELAEQPISLIRELLQLRLMVKVKALQLIQLNGPGPSFQGKASFSKFQKEAKEVLLLAIPLIRCH